MEELLSCMDVTELWAPGCPQTLALAGHQASPAAPPHTECRSLCEKQPASVHVSSWTTELMITHEPHFSGEKCYFVPWYPSKPHASPPLLTPTLSRCCSGSEQGPNPHATPHPPRCLSCLKHLKQHSSLLFWDLDLIPENWAVLAKWGPLKGSALQPLNLLTFFPTAPASPWPHSSSHSPRASD